ncbi:unnamed protein product [Miscanthus lutarioriparius]|uniref:Uncharacterized protein n=1 Tax=Miscanthus lutarioriparius TaxID=422564 RepID=A0A811MGX6_9POAL|nr:unnamed protein product [Miscanthus lutarioriparius]
MSSRALTAVLVFCFLSTSPFAAVSAQMEPQAPPTDGACGGPPVGGKCHSVASALRLKLIAIPSILLASLLGVCLPLFSRSVPALRPDGNLFVVVKAFASGVILVTGYMHVLPDSFNDLSSPCLPRRPWAEFPFTAFVAMLAAVFTLMMDSLMLSFHGRGKGKGRGSASVAHHCHADSALPQVHCHGHGHLDVSEAMPEAADKVVEDDVEAGTAQLRRNRVIVQVTDRSCCTMALIVLPFIVVDLGVDLDRQVLEMGIVVHSVVIGLGMGASQNMCTIRPLVAALYFHQLFFSTTTPFGIALGLALTRVYSDTSPTALIVVGLLNAASAGLLHYMALVDLLAADFMGPKLQSSVRLQLVSFLAVPLGAGGMSVMGKWA